MEPNRIHNIAKSAGRTTFDVVRMYKRAFGIEKVGHAGSLDRPATGVVLLCSGHATKVTPFLMDLSKTYDGTFRLGTSTDTHDAEGRVTEESPVGTLSETRIEEALRSFLGRQLQVPPMVSALKHHGKPLYRLARMGIEVERKPRPITIDSIEPIAIRLPDVRVRVRCSRGTYMRALAYDFGKALGLPAHLSSLCREAIGPFRVEEAVPDQALLDDPSRLGQGWSISEALRHLGRVEVKEEACPAVLQGRQPDLNAFARVPECYGRGEHLRLTDSEGRVLAVARAAVASSETRPLVLPGHPFRLVRVFDRDVVGRAPS